MMCEVKYSELYKQLMGMIVIPLLIAAFFIIIMYLLKVMHVNELVFAIYILVGSVVVVLSGIFIVRKFILINATVESDKNGLHFLLEKSSILYKESEVSVLYNNILKISFGDNDNYRIFVKIKTTNPSKTIFVSPDKYDNNDTFIDYWNEIIEKIEEKK